MQAAENVSRVNREKSEEIQLETKEFLLKMK